MGHIEEIIRYEGGVVTWRENLPDDSFAVTEALIRFAALWTS